MSASGTPSAGPIYFCFADPAGFSGQKAATEIVINGLARRGRTCRRLPQPVLERSLGRLSALPTYLVGLAVSWVRALGLLVSPGRWLCVSLGQTRTAFVRDSVPLLLCWLRQGRSRIVVTLNGSLFMNWRANSIDARTFRFLLGRAGAVTVVGPRQKERLIELGVPRERVVVMINSCELEPLTARQVAAKHSFAADRLCPVRLLHLGSLIDTKGYPEFLEALLRISALDGPPVSAVLCGPVNHSDFSSRFTDVASAEAWIGAQVCEAINAGRRVSVRWVKGAAGAEKAAFFREADVFVLPTRYAVEAQPLVLLEAMASGCAIVTTRAGEITTILDAGSAVFLEHASTEALTPVIASLVGDPSARARLAAAAHDRFVSRFGMEHHLDEWARLLGSPRGQAEEAE